MIHKNIFISVVFFEFIFISTGITETDLATCSFYYWRASWQSAVKACRNDNKELLCYSSKKEIDHITEAFRTATIGSAELDLWLSNKNCSGNDKYVDCLSLHITKTSKAVWHYFEEECRHHYPFICCINGDARPSISTWTPPTADELVEVSTSSAMPVTSIQRYCRSIYRRGILWPQSVDGELVVIPCPGYSKGKAKWRCEASKNGEWDDAGPDMKECRSIPLMELKETFNVTNINTAIALLHEILEDSGNDLAGEDLADIINLISSLVDKISSEIGKLASSSRWVALEGIIGKAAEIFNLILEYRNSWLDISEEKRSQIGSTFVSTVDEILILVTDYIASDRPDLNIEKDNIEIQVVKTQYGNQVMLPDRPLISLENRGIIFLEKGYDDNLNVTHGNASVTFVIYKNMADILSTKYTKNDQLNGTSLNSAVVSVVVVQGKTAIPIQNQVKIIVKHHVSRPNGTVCVFWNMEIREWDTEGCYLEESNDTFSTCVCDHLTNFAVLMDFSSVLETVDPLPFFYITVIGCSLSVICLAVCIAVFTCYSFQNKHSWGLRYIIHRNLCLTLLIANLVLMLGLDRTDQQELCAVIAGMLHYFFLSAFSWMLLEGVHIYLLLVVVFAPRRSHWEKFYLFGYGIPLIIVTVTAICRPNCYGTQYACWLSTEKGAIWAFMGPVALILMMNFAALLLAQWKAGSITIKHDNIGLVKRWLRVTFILFPVLGITWIFGFLFMGNHADVVGYIFAFLNSLQGVCIFVCHCIMDKNARNSVISSLKKKTASVNTGTSSTNKKAKDISKSDAKMDQSNSETLKKVSVLMSVRDTWRKNLPKWHKPWSFCFDMPVSENNIHQVQSDATGEPKPIVVQWNNLHDKL